MQYFKIHNSRAHFRQVLLIGFLCFFLIQKSNGQTITMPNIIGSNMVLQQNTQVSLWGWGTAGTNVTVTASWGQNTTVTSNSNGKWIAKIQTPVATPGQAPTYTITVSGPSNTITFTNILIGEVWLCSGQSNMWFRMNYYYDGMAGVVDYTNEIAAANYPNIRLFTVPDASATTPQNNCGGSWLACNSTTIRDFSAVGYYFGRELYKALNIPIGLIKDAYGGSGIQAWMKDSVLRADPELKKKYIDQIPSNARVSLQPSLLYNAMIAPIIPYAIKGVIWYQGESNFEDGSDYTKANVAMLNDWRNSWGIDFPFYAVQIAPYLNSYETKDLSFHRAFIREAQAAITSEPKTGIVATSDLLLNQAERYQIHPRNKKDVGIRLSLWALTKDYGLTRQYKGPQYLSYTVEGNNIRINYEPESLGSGLITKDGANVACFKMAGSDKRFYPALGVIDGNTVVVSSPYVSNPVAVRYAFTNAAMTNLMNKEGLPAYQFRTDSWAEWTQPAIPYVDLPEITAVSDMQLENKKLYPNPFRNYITVAGINNGVKQIEVFDMLGKKIKYYVGNDLQDVNIDVSGLAVGTYMLRVLYNDMKINDFKAIKQ